MLSTLAFYIYSVANLLTQIIKKNIIKRMMKKIRQVVRVFDVFSAPITFNFDGQEEYKSFVGGVSTIIVSFLIIVSFQSQIVVFSNKETIYFENQNNFYNDPLSLQLDAGKFLFAIKVEQFATTKFTQQPYFQIQVTQQNYTSQSPTPRISTPIDLEPCQRGRFSSLSSHLGEAFDQYQLTDYLCPTLESQMLLKGAFLSQEFDFVRIQIQTCDKTTNQRLWNVPCASSSEIDEYLKQNGNYRLVIYTTNYVVNPTKADNYYELYLAEDLNFFFHPKLKQTVNVFFQQYDVITDQSLFLTQDLVREQFIYREERTFKQETTLLENNSSPMIVYFRSDYFKGVSQRRFMKVDQLFAYFGGIFNIFFLIFGIFVRRYNQIFYKLKMANHLYQYPELQGQNLRRTDTKKVFIQSIQSKKLKLSDANNQKLLAEYGFTSRVEFLYNYFKEMLIRYINLYPGLSYLGYIITFKKKFSTDSNTLVDQSLLQIESDMNVRIVIKKLLEIEKLKKILLNQDQLELFNFMQRPQITTQSIDSEVSKSNLMKNPKGQKSGKGILEFQKLLDAYNQLMTVKNQSASVQFISERLIGLIGQKVVDLLNIGISPEQNADDEVVIEESLKLTLKQGNPQ